MIISTQNQDNTACTMKAKWEALEMDISKVKKWSKALACLCLVGLLPVHAVNAATYLFHNDHLGTPQVLTDATQQVVWQSEQDPFGEVTEVTNQVEHNLRFPGQYFDLETGLHYNYFRDYDSDTGRYLQSDPIGLVGGLNTYAYANQNPLSFYDPFGLNWWRILPKGAQNSLRNIPKAAQEKWRMSPQAPKPNARKNKSSNDVPTWAKGQAPRNGENGAAFAERLCEANLKPGFKKGPGSDFSKIKKWGQRDFQRTPLPSAPSNGLPIPSNNWDLYDPSGPLYNPNFFQNQI